MKIFAWDNGQGPWGKAKQPRQQAPKSAPRGQNQPELEDVVNQMAESLRGYWKNRNDGGLPGGWTWDWIVGALVLVWCASGLYVVAPEQQGVVMRFGAYVRTDDPGLNYHAPWPLEKVVKLPVTRVNLLEVGFRTQDGTTVSVPEESLMLTGDQNIVDLAFTVNWQIANPSAYLFNVTDPADTLVDVAESVMRETIGLHPIDDALTSDKAQIQYEAKQRMQAVLDYYGMGVHIVAVALQQVNPPSEVIDSFRDVQAANADKQRMINEAKGYANQIVPIARGDAAKVIQQAEGYKAAKVADATGAAERFEAQVGAYQKAPGVTKDRLYLETMQDVMQDTPKVVVTGKNGGNVLPFLPLDKLMGAKPTQTEAK
jgi:membrane protease subunit HflK